MEESAVILDETNILEEINKDIEKSGIKNDKYVCRLTLYQFFRAKYENNKNRDYVGYILYGRKTPDGKNNYTLDISNIGTLNTVGILSEIDNVPVDDDFYELLLQFYSEDDLKIIFNSMILENGILHNENADLRLFFESIKMFNPDLFKTYEDRKFNQKTQEYNKTRNYKDNAYFYFRYFRLSDKYTEYENVLWKALQSEFGWRNKFKMLRGV